MGDSPNMLKLSLIFSVFLLGTLVIGTSAHECSEECEAKNGTCFWKPPPRNSSRQLSWDTPREFLSSTSNPRLFRRSRYKELGPWCLGQVSCTCPGQFCWSGRAYGWS